MLCCKLHCHKGFDLISCSYQMQVDALDQAANKVPRELTQNIFQTK